MDSIKCYTFAFILLLGVSTASKAYQFEISISKSDTDVEINDTQVADSENIYTNVAYYFDDIEDSDIPYSAQAFVARPSGIVILHRKGRENRPLVSAGIDTQGIGLNWFSIQDDIVFGLFVSEVVDEGTASFSGIENKQRTKQITLGSYLAENTRLVLGLGKVDYDNTTSGFSSSAESKYIELNLAHLESLPSGSHLGFNGEIIYSDNEIDDGKSFNLELTMFPNKSFYIDVATRFVTIGNTDILNPSFTIGNYFSRNFSIDATISEVLRMLDGQDDIRESIISVGTQINF